MNARPTRTQPRHAFTRLDAAAMIAFLSLLALIALPAITRNTFAATGITCVGSLARLTLAWQLYTADNGGKLMNNFGLADTFGTVSAKTYLNWNHNIMDWTTNPSNTNRTLMAASKLYPYLENPTNPFKCPADRFISAPQTQAGWTGGRLRSYSMNGYMGAYAVNTSDPSYQGRNFLTANYRQFILNSSIPNPAGTSVFLDEHPDSINDGYFINVPSSPSSAQWYDLPGSHHNGAGGVSFADGHAEMHSWTDARTRPPVRFTFPAAGPSPNNLDHRWLTERMTVLHQTLSVTSGASEAKIVWTPTTSTYLLQSSPSLETPDWTNVPETPARASGQLKVTTPTTPEQRYFRLFRPM